MRLQVNLGAIMLARKRSEIILMDEVISLSKNAKQIIEYNQLIIEDNVFHALKRGYSEVEVDEYLKTEAKNMDELKTHLKKNGSVVLHQITQMYVPAPDTIESSVE